MQFRRYYELLGILTIAGIACFTPTRALSSELNNADIKEIRRIEAALADGSLPRPPDWRFQRCDSEVGKQELARLGYPSATQDLETVVRNAGGWAEYKANAAALLKSKDRVVRGLMALWVADLGHSACVPQLWELLQAERPAEDRTEYRDWDRGQAACALGVLNAQDHLNDLLECLHHKSPEIRSGAAEGLSWMKAAKSAPEIAALLADRNDDVVCAAIVALARLQATQYVEQLTAIATDLSIAYQLNHVAMNALVELDAKDQAAEIARLMEDVDASEIRGHAILCIALLDGQEFASDIAAYIDDYNVGDEAIAALGIMRQTQYAHKLASRLDSNYGRTRRAAAWSLIMMESKAHGATALKVYNEFDLERSRYFRLVSAASNRRLKLRFEGALKKLKQAAQ